MIPLLLLLCSHSPNDVPPEPQWNVSIAAVWGAVRPSSVDPTELQELLLNPWKPFRTDISVLPYVPVHMEQE